MIGQAAPGFFGKMPALGDFVCRRLPKEFVDPWDEWLQSSMRASREGLGERWLDCYLTSPVWRFVLSPGLCGSAAWAGILMPSVDRVGRYFPLTLANAFPHTVNPLYLAERAGDWFDRAESAVLSVLEEYSGLPRFEKLLANLPQVAPPEDAGSQEAPPDGRFVHVPLTRLNHLTDAYGGLLQALARGYAPYSFWWSAGSERVDASVMLSRGLPPVTEFTILLGTRAPRETPDQGGLAAPAPEADRDALDGLDLFGGDPEVPSATLRYKSFALTHPGTLRATNEDACSTQDEIGVWSVADGMGGHEAGDTASEMIIDALARMVAPEDMHSLVTETVSRLQRVNERIWELSGGALLPDRTIGSTVAVLLAGFGEIACVWAGDTRIYRLRDGELVQLTTDHSAGAEDAREGRDPSGAGVVTRAVGVQEVLPLEVAFFTARAGDRYLICSDGLYRFLNSDDLVSCLCGSCEEACKALLDFAIQQETDDNVTAVVVDALPVSV